MLELWSGLGSKVGLANRLLFSRETNSFFHLPIAVVCAGSQPGEIPPVISNWDLVGIFHPGGWELIFQQFIDMFVGSLWVCTCLSQAFARMLVWGCVGGRGGSASTMQVLRYTAVTPSGWGHYLDLAGKAYKPPLMAAPLYQAAVIPVPLSHTLQLECVRVWACVRDRWRCSQCVWTGQG